MLYYKVPVELDQRPCYEYKNGKRIYKGFLIDEELLTLRECEKMCAPIAKMIPTHIKKTETYFFFGARFQKGASKN